MKRVHIYDVIPRKVYDLESHRRAHYIPDGVYPAVWQGHYILIRTGEDELLQGITKVHSKIKDLFAAVRVVDGDYWIEEVLNTKNREDSNENQ